MVYCNLFKEETAVALQGNHFFLPMAKARGFQKWKDLVRRLEAAAVEVIARQFVSLLGAAPDLLAWAVDEGYPYVRALPDGRLVGVALLLGGQADVWRGTRDGPADLWTYADAARAVQAAHAWDGTGAPPGGHRHQPGGSRPPPPP